MYKMGTQTPRSLKSLGVAGLLSETCKVYYENCFSVRHLGRIADLLNARIKHLGLDELRFRTAVLTSLYEAYFSQLSALGKLSLDVLTEPLVIECGFDEDKMAIGVEFSYFPDELPDPSLGSSVCAGRAETRLECFVARVAKDSHQTVVRVVPATRRIEVVGLFALSEKNGVRRAEEMGLLEVLVLDSDVKPNSVTAEYIELGDIDYTKLLKDDRPDKRADQSGTGEYFVKAFLESETKATVISGGQNESESERRIARELLEKGRQLNLILQQKELELRNKESSYKENFERSQEQITQLMIIVQREKDLKEKYDLMAKQCEEFRKANQQLMEQKVSAKSQAQAPVSETVKEKLAAAMKLNVKQQKELQDLRSQLESANQSIALQKKNGKAGQAA